MKKALLSLAIGLIAGFLFGALAYTVYAGIPISSNFSPSFQLPLDDRTVMADTTARDAIPAIERFDGLMVYVVADNTIYQLQGGITNGDWVAITSGGGVVGENWEINGSGWLTPTSTIDVYIDGNATTTGIQAGNWGSKFGGLTSDGLGQYNYVKIDEFLFGGFISIPMIEFESNSLPLGIAGASSRVGGMLEGLYIVESDSEGNDGTDMNWGYPKTLFTGTAGDNAVIYYATTTDVLHFSSGAGYIFDNSVIAETALFTAIDTEADDSDGILFLGREDTGWETLSFDNANSRFSFSNDLNINGWATSTLGLYASTSLGLNGTYITSWDDITGTNYWTDSGTTLTPSTSTRNISTDGYISGGLESVFGSATEYMTISSRDFIGGGLFNVPLLEFTNTNALGQETRVGAIDFGLFLSDAEDGLPTLGFFGSNATEPYGIFQYSTSTQTMALNTDTASTSQEYFNFHKLDVMGTYYPIITGVSDNGGGSGLATQDALIIAGDSPLLAFYDVDDGAFNLMQMSADGLLSLGGISASRDATSTESGLKEVLTASGSFLSRNPADEKSCTVYLDSINEAGEGAFARTERTGAVCGINSEIGLADWVGGLTFETFSTSTGSTTPVTNAFFTPTDINLYNNTTIEEASATTTLYIKSGGAGLGGSIILEDEGGGACTVITTSAGTINSAVIACP